MHNFLCFCFWLWCIGMWLQNLTHLPRELHDTLASSPPAAAAVIYLEVMRSNFLHAADLKSPESCLHQIFFPVSDAFGHSIISYKMNIKRDNKIELNLTSIPLLKYNPTPFCSPLPCTFTRDFDRGHLWGKLFPEIIALILHTVKRYNGAVVNLSFVLSPFPIINCMINFANWQIWSYQSCRGQSSIVIAH